MLIKQRTVLHTILISTVLVSVIYFASEFYLTDIIVGFETIDVHHYIEHTISAVNAEIEALDTFNQDWASWDDTYDFVADRNEEYIKSNLVDETFRHTRINVMVFYNSSGSIVFAKAFDVNKDREVEVPAFFRELAPNDPLLSHNSADSRQVGVLMLPDGPLLYSSRPILRSDKTGPIRGTLIMGKYIDPFLLGKLSERVGVPISIYRPNDTALPKEEREALASLSQQNMLVKPLSSSLVAGYALLSDYRGNPALLLKIEIPRNFYAIGMQLKDRFTLVIILLIILTATVVYALLDLTIVSKLTFITNSVRAVMQSRDMSKRIPVVKGSDELTHLSEQINQMLDEIESLHKKMIEEEREHSRKLEEKVKERTAELEKRLRQLEEFKEFAITREKEVMELRKKVKELEGGG